MWGSGGKIGRMLVSFDIIEKILKGKNLFRGEVETNAPEDIEIVGIQTTVDGAIQKRCVVFLKSESFNQVIEGQEIPLIDPFWYKEINQT